jgi:hypothetical protein
VTNDYAELILFALNLDSKIYHRELTSEL